MLKKHNTAILVSPIATWLPEDIEADWIGIDGGFEPILKAGHECLFAVGDFDTKSLPSSPPFPALVLPVAKDETDSEMAMKVASEMGYETIYFVGAFGKRLDHTLANIRCVVWKYPQVICLEEKQRLFTLLPGQHKISGDYTHISFFAYMPSVITLEGFLYPLTKKSIDQKDLYTCSNSLIQKQGLVTLESGRVLCVQSNCQ